MNTDEHRCWDGDEEEPLVRRREIQDQVEDSGFWGICMVGFNALKGI